MMGGGGGADGGEGRIAMVRCMGFHVLLTPVEVVRDQLNAVRGAWGGGMLGGAKGWRGATRDMDKEGRGWSVEGGKEGMRGAGIAKVGI